jgi:inhibitor of cysteine peptidase
MTKVTALVIAIMLLGTLLGFSFNNQDQALNEGDDTAIDESNNTTQLDDQIQANKQGDKLDESEDKNQISNKDFYDSRQYQNIEIYVESLELVIMESFPVQVRAIVSGQVPDNCRESIHLKVSYDSSTRIFNIDVRAKPLSGAPCMMIPMGFEKSDTLDVYGLPKGKYKVQVNGMEKEFTLGADNKPG